MVTNNQNSVQQQPQSPPAQQQQQQKQDFTPSTDYHYFKTGKCAKCKQLGVFICEHDTVIRDNIHKSYAEEGIYHSSPRKPNENAIDYSKYRKSSTSNAVYAKNSSASNGTTGNGSLNNGTSNNNSSNMNGANGTRGSQKTSKISNGTINGNVKDSKQDNSTSNNNALKKEEKKGCCEIM